MMGSFGTSCKARQQIQWYRSSPSGCVMSMFIQCADGRNICLYCAYPNTICLTTKILSQSVGTDLSQSHVASSVVSSRVAIDALMNFACETISSRDRSPSRSLYCWKISSKRYSAVWTWSELIRASCCFVDHFVETGPGMSSVCCRRGVGRGADCTRPSTSTSRLSRSSISKAFSVSLRKNVGPRRLSCSFALHILVGLACASLLALVLMPRSCDDVAILSVCLS